MTYKLSDQEKQGVLSSPDEKQYSYFVNKVTDWGEVWSLNNGERWASLGDPEDDDKKLFPAWPHPDYASDVATGKWAAFEPTPIEIHRFLEHCKTLESDGQDVAVMHQPSGDFLQMPPGPLAEDLRAALEQVE